MKVYIVTSGAYSDYGIRGVFIDKAAAQAFVKAENVYRDPRIEVWEGYDHLPEREVWHVIEEIRRGTKVIEQGRRTELRWPWASRHYVGEKRKTWNYHRWESGERAWGTDEAAVEKVWKEQHAAEEALEAGL